MHRKPKAELLPLDTKLERTLRNLRKVKGVESTIMAYQRERMQSIPEEEVAWSVEDLKGISPSICMHKILLEENAKTLIEHQRRLNPVMKEVFIKEVLKWMNIGFIYAISDNPWVSPVMWFPKMVDSQSS